MTIFFIVQYRTKCWKPSLINCVDFCCNETCKPFLRNVVKRSTQERINNSVSVFWVNTEPEKIQYNDKCRLLYCKPECVTLGYLWSLMLLGTVTDIYHQGTELWSSQYNARNNKNTQIPGNIIIIFPPHILSFLHFPYHLFVCKTLSLRMFSH